MKQLLLICCIFLLIGQFNVYGLVPIDDVNPLNQLKPTLTIKANVYFGNEDEESFPIARTDFYLLDKSLVNILKDSGFQPEFSDGNQHKIEEEDYFNAIGNAFLSDNEESALIAVLIKEKISKNKSFLLKTDDLGQAKVKAAKEGKYYLFGIGRTEDEIFIWHFPVSIKSGNNIIELDQHNAEIVLSIED